MLYTVGEMAKKLQVAPSTLRYYDKEGLLPFVERSNGGIRMFKDTDFEWLQIINCLKKAGMSLKDIKAFIFMTMKGDDTLKERYELFTRHKEVIEAQMAELQETLDAVNYKCWYYQKASEAGTTKVVSGLSIDEIPEEHRKTYMKLKGLEEGE